EPMPREPEPRLRRVALRDDREPERLPERARALERVRRDAVLEELPARAHVVAGSFAPSAGPRPQQRPPPAAPGREQPAVELVVGESGLLELDARATQRARVVAQLGADERQQRAVLRSRVQADCDAAVGQRDVRMLELVADRDRLEAERSIESK